MKEIIEFVKDTLKNDNSGHDIKHAIRVYNNAKKILKTEHGNDKIVLTAALIHDTVDSKLFKDVNKQLNNVKDFLIKTNYSKAETEEIIYIISNISWNYGENKDLDSLNAKIVRDADRLDAIGAIGIIRTIVFGNSRNREFYNDCNLKLNKNGKIVFGEISNSTLSHFYEKLLLLKDLLHTSTAKQIAQKKHEFMLLFLQQFYDEL